MLWDPERKVTLVIDDSAYNRRTLTQLLEAGGEVEVIGSAPDGDEGLKEALRLDPACGPAHQRLAIWSYYQGDFAGAWKHVYAAREAGDPVPPQFLEQLRARMPEPGAG